MDRRQFLAAGSALAAAPMLGASAAQHSAPAAPGAVAVAEEPGPGHVDFTSDGLGLDPAHYATLLRDTAVGTQLVPDQYSRGGAVGEIEQKFARMLGKQAAVFLPTGTLANHLAVRTLAGDRRRVLVQAESHLYNDSGDCAQALSGLNLVPLAEGRATPTLDEIRRWVERSAGGRVETRVGAISLESPVRRLDHRMVDPSELERISRYARDHDIRMHLDGARLFNLPLHSGRSVGDYASLFDTVYVSLWKHFNAASGAILAGDASVIDGLFHVRRMFGGSLPFAWPQVALAGRYADTYLEDYARAWQAADRLGGLLGADARFVVRKVPDGTSRFLLEVPAAAAEAMVGRARERGVVLPGPAVAPGAATAVFRLQVNPTLLRVDMPALARVLVESLGTAHPG